ncbi:dual specificity tyrosine-phosphorylation-regulated kinase 2-like [Rhinophrynus dorsalis]
MLITLRSENLEESRVNHKFLKRKHRQDKMERVRKIRYSKKNVQKNMTSCTPYEAMLYFRDKLTAFEHREIFSYPVIYFFGHHAKKYQSGRTGDPHNCGFDDRNGFYKVVPNDHIAYRYEVLTTLGKGAFGQVVKAYDHKLHEYVAIKMVRNDRDYSRHAEQEIKILQKIKELDPDNKMNVVHLLEGFTFRNHVCMIFELLGPNLYNQLVENRFQGFSLSVVAKLAVDILQCLEGLQKNRITHCDLKLDNIVSKREGSHGVKVIDFGISMDDVHGFHPIIGTRYYRAPEVMLGHKYGMPIDMWSFGCILAELLTGCALFPGEDQEDQMACIIEVLGMPPEKLLKSSTRGADFFTSSGYPLYCTEKRQKGRSWVPCGGFSPSGKFRGPPGSRKLMSTLKGRSDLLFLNFLKKCLQWDPALRMTPSEALCHPWLRHYLPKPASGENVPTTHIVENRLPIMSDRLLPNYFMPNGQRRRNAEKKTTYKVPFR